MIPDLFLSLKNNNSNIKNLEYFSKFSELNKSEYEFSDHLHANFIASQYGNGEIIPNAYIKKAKSTSEPFRALYLYSRVKRFLRYTAVGDVLMKPDIDNANKRKKRSDFSSRVFAVSSTLLIALLATVMRIFLILYSNNFSSADWIIFFYFFAFILFSIILSFVVILSLGTDRSMAALDEMQDMGFFEKKDAG